jgi:hypothetical protein
MVTEFVASGPFAVGVDARVDDRLPVGEAR